MRLNVFRNRFIDAQVGYLVDSMIDARRAETEAYWRRVIMDEIKADNNNPILRVELSKAQMKIIDLKNELEQAYKTIEILRGQR